MQGRGQTKDSPGYTEYVTEGMHVEEYKVDYWDGCRDGRGYETGPEFWKDAGQKESNRSTT